jgi:hypothetical protein
MLFFTRNVKYLAFLYYFCPVLKKCRLRLPKFVRCSSFILNYEKTKYPIRFIFTRQVEGKMSFSLKKKIIPLQQIGEKI